MIFSKLFNKTTTYTAADINAAMMIYINNYISSISESIEKKQYLEVPKELQQEYNKLCSLGLQNTTNAKILEAKIDEIKKLNDKIESDNSYIEHLKEAYIFMKELHKVFGTDAMLIRFDDFKYLLKKYNLVCGKLSSYQGSIPEKNVQELSKVTEIIESLEDKDWYGYQRLWQKNQILKKGFIPIYLIEEIGQNNITKETRELLSRFPYSTNDRFVEIGSLKLDRNVQLDRKYNPLFIAAPAQEMNTSVKFTDRVISQDPFICSYSQYGIVVFSKWGEEAEDEILDKYYKLVNYEK